MVAPDRLILPNSPLGWEGVITASSEPLGWENLAIAETLFITGGAVEKHVKCIFGKLGLAQGEADHRRVLAVLAYLRG